MTSGEEFARKVVALCQEFDYCIAVDSSELLYIEKGFDPLYADELIEAGKDADKR